MPGTPSAILGLRDMLNETGALARTRINALNAVLEGIAAGTTALQDLKVTKAGGVWFALTDSSAGTNLKRLCANTVNGVTTVGAMNDAYSAFTKVFFTLDHATGTVAIGLDGTTWTNFTLTSPWAYSSGSELTAMDPSWQVSPSGLVQFRGRVTRPSGSGDTVVQPVPGPVQFSGLKRFPIVTSTGTLAVAQLKGTALQIPGATNGVLYDLDSINYQTG